MPLLRVVPASAWSFVVAGLPMACGNSDGTPKDDTSESTTMESGASESTFHPSSSNISTGTLSSSMTESEQTTGGDTEGENTEGTSFDDLCAKPGVVFCDDFEGAWDSSWVEDGGDVRVVAGSAVVGEGSSVLELATYANQQSSKLIRTFADSNEIYIRFDVQYDVGYDNSGGSHGPILGGSSAPPWGILGTAGIKPNGDDHFVLNFEPIGTVGQAAEFGFYAYFANMQPDGHGDFWGNVFRSNMQPSPVIVANQWHCAEYGLQVNAIENSDGRADFWVDGVHHGSFGDFQWRTSADLTLNTFVLDSYNHFNDGAPAKDQANLVRYDNLVISTAPIGCLTSN